MVVAYCGPQDNLAAMAVLNFVVPGNVVMTWGSGATNALIGDLWAISAQRFGVAVIVFDGLVVCTISTETAATKGG